MPKRDSGSYPYVCQFFLRNGQMEKRLAYKTRESLETDVRAAVQNSKYDRLTYAGPALQMDWTRGK